MSTSTNSVQQGEQGLALVAMIIISIILFLVVWLKGTVYATCAFLHSCWGILLALPGISPCTGWQQRSTTCSQKRPHELTVSPPPNGWT